MAYETGPPPRLPAEDRSRRFSWKGLLVVVIALAALISPVLFAIFN